MFRSARPILPVRICVVRALSAFFSSVCIFSRFLLSGTDCAMEGASWSYRYKGPEIM